MEIKLLDPGLEVPRPATEYSAGYDLRSTLEDFVLYPGETKKVLTGIAVHMQEYSNDPAILPCALILPRSGLGCKGIKPRNAPGLIDADYQGEIIVCLHNDSLEPFKVNKYDRIAQLMFTAAVHVTFQIVTDFGNTTARGNGGLGSTGQA